ncbi:sulfite exporter TauE/SafE family protein [Alicyclobacillus sp. SO9]|uniref:sulfite exporter TauE/SafE family protein n=1 Tax=Alicyclobacillus sp. SO9 TaxID=2665646 RepID=UPI0018E82B5A|nr:sulfite exporter TauE/SafE family protein [Alicyclobacillus sp. SO9]QQE78241.1 sulfite exporter TauE/SafE family protein [Alicyclobacillus sp. SO9]
MTILRIGLRICRRHTSTPDKDPSRYRTKVLLTGGFGGLFGALLGIGGSFLVIPILSGPLRIAPKQAHSSALPVAFVGGLSSLFFYLSAVHMHWFTTGTVIISSLCGVLFGARMMRFLNVRKLETTFGFILCGVALLYAFHLKPISHTSLSQHYVLRTAGPLLLGLLVGLVSGAFGAGGGALLVPGAVLLFHYNQQAAQSLSIMTIIPTTLLGSWVHFREKNLSLDIVFPLSIAACLGGAIGGILALHVHTVILRSLLIVALIYIGISNIRKYWTFEN